MTKRNTIVSTEKKQSRRICVVGAGRWGMNHIRTLDRLGYLAGIVESDEQTHQSLADQYPSVALWKNIREAMDGGYDGFTVATPAATHFDIAQFLIEQGKHVLVEKPITLTAGAARDLQDLAEERGVNLMVGHLMLFHPAIRKMKELIDGGTIGRLQYIYSNRLNLGTVRQEENILWSFAPHDISIFQHFTGSFPREIVSRGGMFLQPHIHDSSMTVLAYPDHCVGHIFVSWLHPFKEHRIVVIGSKGMLSYEDSSQDRNILFYEKGIDWVQGEPIKHEGPTDIIPYEKIPPLDEELNYFADHLDGSPIGLADGRNGVEVLEILEAATESLLGTRQAAFSQSVKGDAAGRNWFAHDSACIDEGVSIGSGTKIWHFSHILSGTVIGDGCNIGQNVVIGPDVTVGKGCKIQNNVCVYKGVTLEDDVFCGPSMVFTNVVNPRAEIRRMDEIGETLVRQGATIGANATIVCGATIGKYAFIGAGAVVTGNVPDYALMMGNPARRKGWMCRCGVRLTDSLTCPACGLRYELQDDRLGMRP